MRVKAAWYWDKRGVRGDRKESELGLATGLLAQLELKKRVITGDALYCQRNLSRKVLKQGGDYFWVLKDNQPGVKEAVSLLFKYPPWGEELANTRQEGRRGDRWERRRLWASAALNGYLDWPGLGQVCCVERTRRWKGKETVERAYAITSLPPERADADRLLEIWRGHWGIENRLHWVRDMVLGEDLSQVRTGAAPQLLAALRNLVIGMLRLTGVKNISAALRHYAWKPWETLTLIGLPANN
jgi:predicted transposase YbfD/YdcC